jgi:hypothetical protein
MSQPGTDGTGHCILSVYTRTHARATTVEIRAPVLSVPNASDAVNGGEMAQQKPSTVEHGGSSNETPVLPALQPRAPARDGKGHWRPGVRGNPSGRIIPIHKEVRALARSRSVEAMNHDEDSRVAHASTDKVLVFRRIQRVQEGGQVLRGWRLRIGSRRTVLGEHCARQGRNYVKWHAKISFTFL